METETKPYSQWNIQALKNELKFLYIEIGRGNKHAEDINKIRRIEAELVERKIKTIINP